MHQWHTATLAVIVALGLGASAQAANWMCAVDLNGDGNVDGVGETASCLLQGDAQNPVPVCPLDPGTALDLVGDVAFRLSWDPSQGATYYVAHTRIDAGAWREHPPVPASDPLEVSFSYVVARGNTVSGRVKACTATACSAWAGPVSIGTSSATCLDLDRNPPIIETLDDHMYTADGRRGAAGGCLDQVMIFAGRAMECKTAGFDTAGKSCCKKTDPVYRDSVGSIRELSTAVGVVSDTYQIAQAAYQTYAATGSAAAAGEAAGQAALVAFDPTSLAISIAVAVITEYLLTPCDQQSMETSLLSSSGYCHSVGERCVKRWPIGGCVQRAETYCCFNSKLARILHEQGRGQLQTMNPSFVSDNTLDCRGFTPEEFQALDFGKIDFTEYYGDLRHTAQDVLQQSMSDAIQEFNQKVR